MSTPKDETKGAAEKETRQYRITRPWHNRKKGELIELAEVNPAIAGRVELVDEEEEADLELLNNPNATEEEKTAARAKAKGGKKGKLTTGKK